MSRRRNFIAAALVFSLGLHLGLLWWFNDIHVGTFAIPALKKHFVQPTRLKRVEIPPMAPDQAPPTPVAPPPQAQQTAPARLPEATQAMPQSLPGAPPVSAPDQVPGSPAAFAPVVPAPPASTSPYSLNDRAKIDAEIAKLAVGPSAAGLPALIPSTPTLPGATMALGNDVAGQQGKGTTPNTSALPTLDQVTAQFRLPPPTLNPNLPQPVVLTLPTDILFDFDSAQLRPGAENVLQQALAYIHKYPRADVEVDGHTDSFGAADYNQKLSLGRASSVRDWLRQDLPVADFSIVAKGLGSTRPVVPQTGTIVEQQKNRRVEIVLRAIAPTP